MQRRLQEARERLADTEAAHADALNRLHRRIAELEDSITTAEHARIERTQPDYRSLGQRIVDMLELAQTEANAIRERAAREAEETVGRARREAERLTEGEREKQESLQRQLTALHENLASILGVVPAGVAAAAGVTTDQPAAETAPADPATAYPAEEPQPAAPPRVIDLLDDSTQVVHVIPASQS